MDKKITCFSFLILSLALFSSCLTMDLEISINRDNSGTARLVYSLSTLAMDINRIDSEKTVLNIPLTREDFESAALLAGGILINDYEMTDDGSRYNINSLVSFDSIESLGTFTGIEFLLEETGNNKLLTIRSTDASLVKEISEQTLDIIRESFPDDFISLIITIPGEIIRVAGATFSGSDVSFKISVEDFLRTRETIQLTVEYR
ncbi:MAG: hypothetical protein JEY91_12145 [Spirochaetaceae bacterium]|nr:hypothetical protein [Spirochaetaceae bacterium]